MTVVVFRNDHGGLKIDRVLLKNRFVEFGRMPSSIFSFVLVESGFRLTISAVVHGSRIFRRIQTVQTLLEIHNQLLIEYNKVRDELNIAKAELALLKKRGW